MFPFLLIAALFGILAVLVIQCFQLNRIERNQNQKIAKTKFINDLSSEPNKMLDQKQPIGFRIGQNGDQESTQEQS